MTVLLDSLSSCSIQRHKQDNIYFKVFPCFGYCHIIPQSNPDYENNPNFAVCCHTFKGICLMLYLEVSKSCRLRMLLKEWGFIIVAFLQNTTIEYSPESVCVSVFPCFCAITQKVIDL